MASTLLSHETLFQSAVQFLTANHWLSGEMQAFWMAVQGAVAVRQGPNKDRHLNWFHAFCLSTATGFAGGWLGFVFMGLPSSMLSNDLNFGSCILAFWLVNYTPLDLGYRLCTTAPVVIITTAFAQIFRSVAICRFCNTCFSAFRDHPSPYYPIPVFGPILYATMLGNMGGFVLKGFNGYVKDGMPWAFQNGFFIATWYHFYVHDQDGPIGAAVRHYTPVTAKMVGLDDETFGVVVVSLFMQIMGFLHLPFVIGPSFSPFVLLREILLGSQPAILAPLHKHQPRSLMEKATEKSIDTYPVQPNYQNGSPSIIPYATTMNPPVDSIVDDSTEVSHKNDKLFYTNPSPECSSVDDIEMTDVKKKKKRKRKKKVD